MTTILSVQNLCKEYESFALKNVSFDVRKGEIVGFIGRNGAGKTTTLKSLLNLVHPTSGDIRFFGESFAENELDIKDRIGFVSGGIDFYLHKKLRTITDVTRRFYRNWDDAAYRRYMVQFKLDEQKTPHELSAGMKVKYNLALALSHHAELLILDEPTSGLDPISRDELLDIFLELAREGVSILFSTHITSDLDKCADRIAYIKNGQIVLFDPLQELIQAYRYVELEQDAINDSIRQKLIGLKLAKHGYTAIVRAEDAEGLDTQPTDLETIMIHMEKEEA